ncbi:MAG: hypothetical protein HKP14_09465 [Bacteroidia bacterium]|nr:hypothetical protein [Bacteroidia bacterium]
MIKDITQNELLLLAYKELSPKEHSVLLSRVLKNKELTQAYHRIIEQMDMLDTVSYSPNPTTIQIVKEESCSSSPLELI